MYNGGSKGNIPKNLDVCLTMDYTTEELFSWIDKLVMPRLILSAVLLIIGVFLAYNESEFAAGSDMQLMVAVQAAAPWFASVIVMEFLFDFARTVVKALAHIVHNTKVAANVAVLNASSGTVSKAEKGSGTTSVNKPAAHTNPAFGTIPTK